MNASPRNRSIQKNITQCPFRAPIGSEDLIILTALLRDYIILFFFNKQPEVTQVFHRSATHVTHSETQMFLYDQVKYLSLFGLKSESKSTLISSETKIIQFWFSAVHYLKISEQR